MADFIDLVEKLAPKQKLFVLEYIESWNMTKAAIAAEYSEKTAYSQGSRLLKKAEVAEAVQAYLNEYAMTRGEVLFHLTEIARGDFEDISDSAGFLDMQKARKNRKTRLIKKTKQRTTTSENHESHEVEVEMYDRLTALGMLAKYHNLLTEKVEHSGTVTVKTAHELSDDELAKVAASGITTSSHPG